MTASKHIWFMATAAMFLSGAAPTHAQFQWPPYEYAPHPTVSGQWPSYQYPPYPSSYGYPFVPPVTVNPYVPTTPPSWSYNPYTSGLGPCPQRLPGDPPCSETMVPSYGQPSYWPR
jgi:hypothetical protein